MLKWPYRFIRCEGCRNPPLTAEQVMDEIWARQQTFRTVYEYEDSRRAKA